MRIVRMYARMISAWCWSLSPKFQLADSHTCVLTYSNSEKVNKIFNHRNCVFRPKKPLRRSFLAILEKLDFFHHGPPNNMMKKSKFSKIAKNDLWRLFGSKNTIPVVKKSEIFSLTEFLTSYHDGKW